MAIFIYNSLTSKKEEFIPLKPPEVNIYACGVTVYDECHIGHARSLYIFDLIRRYLQYRGFKVKFVRNITDIDDKIIKRANEFKTPWQDLVKKYIDSYYQDLKILGIEKAEIEPRATENIRDMVKYIQGLIDKGYAYESGGDVYFSLRKFSAYGKLSGQGIEAMETGARIEPSENKRDPLDFALWKKSKQNEPAWDSPWSKGRPGWHIECSLMAKKFLKADPLDIRAGGRDLIFPHHENEIAQSEALTDKPFAKYWLHHGLLTINSQKMSKSLGNFVTIKDFMDRHYDANLLKLFFLSAHYSHPVDYNDAKIEETRQALERISILLGKTAKKAGAKKITEIEELKKRFIEAMDDDFNTPQALAVIFELVNIANKKLGDGSIFLRKIEPSPFRSVIVELLGILGIALKEKKEILNSEIKAKIAQRNKARKNKDYALSDKIRKELEAKGIILEDVAGGKTTWRSKHNKTVSK